jgi:hypothetical protein
MPSEGFEVVDEAHLGFLRILSPDALEEGFPVVGPVCQGGRGFGA